MRLLSLIKKDMEFNRNLATLIDVLKDIAISQYHILEKRVKSYERPFLILQELFDIVPTENARHPLLNLSQRQPGVIAVTSDTGLLGALNMEVMSLAMQEVQNNQARLIIIGEKGKAYAQELEASFTAFVGIKDEQRLSQAAQLRDYIVEEELKLRLGALKIIYPYAASLMNQRIHSLQLLPFSGIKGQQARPVQEIIMESSAGDIAGYLVYLLLGHKFYEIFGLSRLAEMAARFVHLEESGHKLEDIKKELQLQYFRQRHEMIDRNMREIFAARAAFR
jgi:ATP synthase F1 gamma subunit